MSSVARKTYFKDCWLINEEYSSWIKSVTMMSLLSNSIGVEKKIMLSNMGEKAVKNNMSRDSHKNAKKRVKSTRSIS